MLDAKLKTQLKAYLEKITQPIEIVASLDASAKSLEMRSLLQEIEGLSDRITLTERPDDPRKPSFSLSRPGSAGGLRFAAIPLGHEFTSLVLALLQVGGHPVKLDADVIEQIRNVEGEYNFETYVSLSCQSCPDVVQALNAMSVINPNIRMVTIDGALYQEEVEKRQIMAVPSTYLNGELFSQGRTSVEEILAKLDSKAGTRKAEQLSAQEPFEVLIVGGGPCRRGSGDLRRPQRHPHGCGDGAVRRPGPGHVGHRELHLDRADRRAAFRHCPGAACEGV
jgi:alkyl hydroperoxide reductase subunit F